MIGIVVVHYYNTPEVRRYVRALAKSPMPKGKRREIVIVNNGGDLPESLARRHSNVEVVRPKANLGYGNGCSVGVTTFEERKGVQPEWWIVSNTDVRFKPSFFQRLHHASWPTNAALLAPDIRETNAWPRNPFYRHRPPSKKVRRRILLLSSSFLLRLYITAAQWKRSLARPPAVPLDPRPIYAAHGSLLVFHRCFFDQGGTLSYDGFLYGEEIHVAEQIRRMGLQVLWAPSLQARHQQGTTMNDVPIKSRCKWWRESYEFLYQTYFWPGDGRA